MAGISSRAAGTLVNKEKTFQEQRFDDDLGLNWVQFKWRNHDPQIGRFVEIDPLSEKYVYNSTYAFSENKVIAHVELEGLESMWAFFKTLTNSAGLRENTNSREFLTQTASTLKEPETYTNAIGVLGPVAGAALVGIFTGGVGTTSTLAETTTARITTSEASVATLEVRAKEIQGVLSPRTQNATTTAVASATSAEGRATTLVASSENSLRKEQLAALKPGEVAVSGKGHAEVTILNHAATNGMQVSAVAASRPICVGCATAINNAGAVPASPLKIIPQATAASTYVKPPVVIEPIKPKTN